MGITATDIKLLEKALSINPDIETVIEAGAQNLYLNGEQFPPFANTWYEQNGIEYNCIDLSGDNGALKYDLAYPLPIKLQYDLVTNFGTGEHVVQMEGYETVSFHEGHIHSIYPKGVSSVELGFYNFCRNIHNLCKIGGIIINVNPLTGHWPLHGYTWLTMEFYTELAKLTRYEIKELYIEAGMGNYETGMNVCCMVIKMADTFPDFETFKKLSYKKN